MTTSGLTNTGFVAETQGEAVADLNAKFLANIDAGLDLDPDQPMGQAIAIFAEKFAELSELGATVYNAINPNGAEGNLLVNLAAISGTRPQVATYSTVVGTLNLNASTTVHAGAVAAVLNQPGNTWVLTADVTSTTSGNYTGTFRSASPGPFVANAGTLTVINTPTIGWNSITNIADAVEGLPADTDTTLRQKREAELAAEGSGDVDAIRGALLKLPGMLQAFVFENTTLTIDANGVPPKSIRVVVWDGVSPAVSNADIANTIWKQKGQGVQTDGTTSFTVLDSAGNPHVVLFDRAIQLPVYVVATTTPSVLTTAQTVAVKAAIKAYADVTFNLGVTIIDLPFRASALVPTVTTDVPTFKFGFSPSPTNTANLPVSGLQIATVSTANILVNGV